MSNRKERGSAPLLATKLYVPSPRPDLVPRKHLLHRLDEALRQGHRLTLVCAPAGYGKTMLVAEWLSGFRLLTQPTGNQQAKAQTVTAWLSLDEEDNDPARFLAYLLAALQAAHIETTQTTQGLSDSAPQPLVGATSRHADPEREQRETEWVKSLVTAIINDIAAGFSAPSSTQISNRQGRFVLVLDDYHRIRSPTVHAALQILLDHQPPSMHLVIITREDPPLMLARRRALGQLTEIRVGDLRFTAEETADFFQHTMGLNLTPKWIAALEARTEGWIAGLQLAAISLKGRRGRFRSNLHRESSLCD